MFERFVGCRLSYVELYDGCRVSHVDVELYDGCRVSHVVGPRDSVLRIAGRLNLHKKFMKESLRK